jgi:hypothetical protein
MEEIIQDFVFRVGAYCRVPFEHSEITGFEFADSQLTVQKAIDDVLIFTQIVLHRVFRLSKRPSELITNRTASRHESVARFAHGAPQYPILSAVTA